MKKLTLLSLSLLVSGCAATYATNKAKTYYHQKAAQENARSAQSHAKQACQDVGSCVEHSAHVVTDVTHDAKDEVIAASKKAAQKIEQKIQEGATKTVDIAHNAKDKVIKIGAQLKNSNPRARKRIVKADNEAIETIAKETETAARKLSAAADEVVHKAQKTANKARKARLHNA